MLSRARGYLPQWLINTFWHLPKSVLANLVYGFPSKKLKVIELLISGGVVVGLVFSHKQHDHTHEEARGYLNEIHADDSAIYSSMDFSPIFMVDDEE